MYTMNYQNYFEKPFREAAAVPSRMKVTSCHRLPDQEGVRGSSAPVFTRSKGLQRPL